MMGVEVALAIEAVTVMMAGTIETAVTITALFARYSLRFVPVLSPRE